MDISALDWKWGKMWAILAPVDSKGLKLSSSLWVACTRLQSGSITRGPREFLTLLLQGVSTLMWFDVVYVSAITYVRLLFGGLPLHLLQLL